MANDREKAQQAETENAENTGNGRKEQFNELSELSLEERMSVANKIGIPVQNVGDAAATGAMRGGGDATEGVDDGTEEENMDEETDR